MLIAEFIQSKTVFLHLLHSLLLPCNGYIIKKKISYFIYEKIKHVLKLIKCNDTLIKIKYTKHSLRF